MEATVRQLCPESCCASCLGVCFLGTRYAFDMEATAYQLRPKSCCAWQADVVQQHRDLEQLMGELDHGFDHRSDAVIARQFAQSQGDVIQADTRVAAVHDCIQELVELERFITHTKPPTEEAVALTVRAMCSVPSHKLSCTHICLYVIAGWLEMSSPTLGRRLASCAQGKAVLGRQMASGRFLTRAGGGAAAAGVRGSPGLLSTECQSPAADACCNSLLGTVQECHLPCSAPKPGTSALRSGRHPAAVQEEIIRQLLARLSALGLGFGAPESKKVSCLYSTL